MGAYWIADAMAGLVGDAALAALGSRILQERVDPQDDGCLVYTGRINRYGYGEVQDGVSAAPAYGDLRRRKEAVL